MISIPLFRPAMSEQAFKNVEWVLKSGQLAEGKVVEDFENALSQVLGFPVLTVNSGTTALYLLYEMVGIEKGTKVITTPITCAATNLALLHRGASIIWADVDGNGLIDPTSVDELLRTNADCKQVVAVDYGGLPAHHLTLAAICENFGAKLLVDAAQSFGAMQGDKVAGATPFATAFSFQAIKTLTTVDGGALHIKDAELMRRAKLKRWFGLDRSQGGFRCEQDIVEVGYKFHMNNLNAAIGLANLEAIPTIMGKAKENADFYLKELAGIDGLILPTFRDGVLPSWWAFIVRVDDQLGFIDFLNKRGVEGAKIHTRNDTKTIFAPFKREGLDGVALYDARQVALPVGVHVTEDEREYVVGIIKKYFNQKAKVAVQ